MNETRPAPRNEVFSGILLSLIVAAFCMGFGFWWGRDDRGDRYRIYSTQSGVFRIDGRTGQVWMAVRPGQTGLVDRWKEIEEPDMQDERPEAFRNR
jgi:hypothetical protein